MASNDAIRAFPRKILLLLIGLLVAVAFAVLAPSAAQAIGYYDVWVGDVHVDGLNCGNVLAESHNGSKGKVRLEVAADDPDHLKLYLDNANIKVADIANNDAAGIYIGPEVKCVDIILKGKNTITMPSGSLSSGFINGISGWGGVLPDDSSMRIYSNASGASLSIALSGDDSQDVYGICNLNHGVEIESVNLSITLSSGKKAFGIAADGEGSEEIIKILKSTVSMSIFGTNRIEGIQARNSVSILNSAVQMNLGQGKTCAGEVFGVYAPDERVDVLGNSNVVINGGASSDSSFGIFGADVWSASDSILHVYAGDAPDSVGMTGNGVLWVEEGSVADFSGYTQAIQSLVTIPSVPTQDLGAFVNKNPTFSGGSVWDGSTALSSYKYVHFPYNLSITEVLIDAIASQNYTGKALMPAFTVRLGNTILSKSTDYAFSYSNNIKPGTATVTITGKGIFAGAGTKTATFTISRKPCNVKNLWASQHDVGKVLFKWTKDSAFQPTGWKVKYRTKKIGGGSWSGWTEKSFGKDIYQFWCTVPVDYVVEIHAKEKADTTYSTGIITTPAGGKYQAMKTVYVKNVATNKRVDTVTLKVGKTVKLKPDYEYPVADYNKRPRLYPNAALWDLDAAGKKLVSISKPDGSAYSGGMIDGAATIKGLKAGTTDLICRAPNGRTKVIKVTVTN